MSARRTNISKLSKIKLDFEKLESEQFFKELAKLNRQRRALTAK